MTLLIILIVIVCLLLVLVVLAQNSKGGGLSSQFGGGGASQMIGVKRTGDLLEKITWGLAIGLLALSLITNVMFVERAPEGPVSPNIQRAQETIIPSPNSAIPGIQGEEAPAVPAEEGDTAQ